MTPSDNAGGCRKGIISAPAVMGVRVMKNWADFIRAVAVLIKAIADLINSLKK